MAWHRAVQVRKVRHALPSHVHRCSNSVSTGTLNMPYGNAADSTPLPQNYT